MDLETLLRGGLNLKENQISYIFRQVLEGMREMHEKHVVHRDIKNANIFISIPQKRYR